MASETLPEPPGMPKAMLCMMDSANRTGSWLTMDTCTTHKVFVGVKTVCLQEVSVTVTSLMMS